MKLFENENKNIIFMSELKVGQVAIIIQKNDVKRIVTYGGNGKFIVLGNIHHNGFDLDYAKKTKVRILETGELIEVLDSNKDTIASLISSYSFKKEN